VGQNFFITGYMPRKAGTSTFGSPWFTLGHRVSTHRFATTLIEPLIIATSSLPTAYSVAYFAQLQGFGGTPPYTWASPNFPLEWVPETSRV